jgi:8-oxo-dGTP pyrophosphatase MutT (NUDIX family)
MASRIDATLKSASKVKQYTLSFILRDHQGSHEVLLGMKKRGFGLGKWNGFGGKIEPTDETIEHAAAREITEEANIDVSTKHMLRKGTLVFTFSDKPEVMVCDPMNMYGN